MASLCKRQQCTVERRGFRQELDSWRHKLIHCVGFESILEGLFGQGLVEDLKLFKACEPEAVSDWSFDENCLFCCLKRDKVKEHLVGLSNEGLEETVKPLLNDQTKINRLEQQAEEFLNAVLCRKDVPSFSDPHIPVVAREIMQRMIRQFAAEYTSKTSTSQDPLPDRQPCSVQSLPRPPSYPPVPPCTSPSGAPPAAAAAAAHNQNPVLSKLLMADQEAPLDLTVKKPKAEPTEQDGVLDLSLRKKRYSSRPVHSPYTSPSTPTVKGESSEIPISKAKELQSTSTLEQFMAKLCLHHQQQIVDALGFLQTEVKALASQAPCNNSEKQENAPSVMTSSLGTCEKSSSELRLPNASTHDAKGMSLVISGTPTTSTSKEVPGEVISLKSINPDPPLDLHALGLRSATPLVNSTQNTADSENNRDHVPLKMKIMKTNKLADGKKLSCVLTTSLLTQTDTVADRQANSGCNPSNKSVSQSARLSSPVKRHSQPAHLNRDGQQDSLGKTKDTSSKLFSPHKTSNTHHTPDTPRTARKTIRDSPDHRPRNSGSRVVIDPDLGHCDIVYINKPITECLREQHGHLPPRRNARKSTRGHMYVEEMWELKTVRTLAGRNGRRSCPNPMPEIVTSVTPKQALTKPDGVPPVDMIFVGSGGETCQQMPTEQSNVREMPETGHTEVGAAQLDLVVETSLTDQRKINEPAASQSPLTASTENGDKEAADVVQEANSMHATESDLSKEKALPKESQLPEESDLPEEGDHEEFDLPEDIDLAEVQMLPKPVEELQMVNEVLNKLTEQQIPECTMGEDAEPVLSESILSEQQQIDTLPSVAEADEEEVRESSGNIEGEQTLEPKLEATKLSDNLVAGLNSTAAPAEKISKEQQRKVIAQIKSDVKHSVSGDEDEEYDVSTKSLQSLLKELPPWRRKKGAVIPLPKRVKETQGVIVGYVNGRPIAASDRSLRRRSSSAPPTPTKATETPSPSVSEHSPRAKHIPETIAAITSEDSSVVPQETEQVPAVPLTPVKRYKRLSKFAIKRRKRRSKAKVEHEQQQTDVPVVPENAPDHLADEPVGIPEHTPSQLPLCSANQPPETTESPITQSAVTSSSPTPSSPDSIRSADVVQPLPELPDTSASSPSVVSPPSPMGSALPVASEQSQKCTDSESPVESSIACGDSAATSAEEIQETTMENVLLTKQKEPRSEEVVDGKAEKPNVCHLVSSLLESQSGISEDLQMQTIPLAIEKTLQKDEAGESEEKPNGCLLVDEPSLEDSNTPSVVEKPARMPLRNESSKAETSNQSLSPQPAEDRKLALRSQRTATASTSAIGVGGRQKQRASPIRRKSMMMSGSLLQPGPETPFVLQPRDPPKQAVHKLFETLNGEDNHHIINNLNIKFDRMQKGWIQMDKEGQPATKYRNRSDRQAAIWKSKRRTRKPKSSEQHKYSPVQMLFMKNFNLTSICQWYLESTETKSLVIIKKINTRLPSETQLCFHSSCTSSSQGVFPSLQAERLKKHLKKFAIASPIKNNAKGQKLIAKALEQESIRAKDRKELPTANQALTRPFSASAKVQVQIAEPHKVSGKSKNPTSARILRKYSNIREKMQVQQTSIGLKEATKSLKCSTLKMLTPAQSDPKPDLKSPLKKQKLTLPEAAQTRVYKPTASNAKANPGRKSTEKPSAPERTAKNSASSRAPRDPAKETVSPQRCSQRLGSPKTTSTSKVNSNKKQLETKKKDVEKSPLAKQSSSKSQTKEPAPKGVSEGETVEAVVETPQQMDLKPPVSPDQVLTRSQRKMDAINVSPALDNPSKSRKGRPPASVSKNNTDAVVTRRGTLKSVGKKGIVTSPSRSVRKATKRSSETLETPVKRTRMSAKIKDCTP
ncbi:mucin-17 isoform X1 [Gadus macrocephalus]|uniref:mucin-17 isoform X1 n=1 Tax=Gadus macrocephalus TaxID=80720 RepID=UPI0028CB6F9E|nr:mucin-17 isoform X1 [Gadus macrocephalus]